MSNITLNILKKLSTFFWRESGKLQYRGMVTNNLLYLKWITFNWRIARFIAGKISNSFGYECWAE